ncbi:putative reverse transcriptase domain-containing protein [Tanacetum coccineum]
MKQRKDSGPTEPIIDEATNEEHVSTPSYDSSQSEIATLKKRVKKLEKKRRSRTYKPRRLYKVSLSRRIESFDDASLGAQEDASKQGRKIADLDADTEDPCEEAARQLLEQAPRSPEYVPDPIELEDHVPVYIPEPEHLEDLVPAKMRHLRGNITDMRAAAPSTYHPLLPLGTLPLLPIPLPAPSTSRRADIPEADTPPQKRLLLIAPRPRCEVGESFAATAARHLGPTMARRVNCSSVDTVDVCSKKSSELYSRPSRCPRRSCCVRAEIEVLRKGDLALQQESKETRRPWLGVAAAMAEAEASRVRNGYNSNGSGPRPAQAVRECSYSEFLKCKPLDFKGTEGVVILTRWFEKMEFVFSISNCTTSYQVKFATCTLQDDALTWWNAYVKTTTPEAAHAMPWATTEEMMPKNTAQWAEKKRKYDDLSKNNQNQQRQNKRQNTGQAYTAGNSDRKPYTGSKPLCSKYDHNHEGPCLPRCNNCKKVGHLAKDCRSRPANGNNNNRNNNNRNNNNNNQKGNGCYECGAQGHFKRNCPKLRNNDRGNQAGNDRAPAKVYVVRNAGANSYNVVAGTFLLNNLYAYILFDTGADQSFLSTAFSFQIDITPSTLDHYYDVKQADRRIIGLNTILSGCTLNFLNHPFNINLMSVELGSFDAIIGMDWLAKYQAIIVCVEKIVRIPCGNETLIIHGDRSN